jgi:fimbrial isopeptide formation D2 family protein/LPXTG-motif cell wall-anchored protein
MNIAPIRRRTRFVPVVVALMLATGGSAVFAAPAAAVELGPNINPDQTGRIALHKYAQPDGATGLPNDGSELSPAQLTGLTPLNGVSFSLRSVGGIDLSTSAGWAAVEDLTAGDVLDDPASYPLSAAGSGATNADGDLTFPALPLGVYVVTETDPGANPIAQPAPPFLVTMPMPTGRNTFLYDVNVYPKNAVTNVTKTVDDATAIGLGDDITWSVHGTVPSLTASNPLNRFDMRDPLDARLGYISSTVTAVDGAGTALPMDPSYYTITAPASGSSGPVQMVTTAAGLTFLHGHPGGVVTLNVVTEVLSIGDGTIENTATLFANSAAPTAQAVSDWGALQIFKYAGTAIPANGLQGAQFRVFTTATDASNQTNPVSIDGADTFTTDGSGNVLLGGLKSGDYYVVETRAPAGYQPNATPHPVTVVTGPVTNPVVLNVENVQVGLWSLPLTGGAGPLVFIGGGLALVAIAIGAGLVVAKRRRRLA